jgi:hypothetical protein
MDAQTTLTLRCTACGALTQAACGCGAGYAYMSPGEMAAKAVKDNPGMSNVALADKLGIDESTVRKARKSTSGNPEVEKRTGKDGRTRRMPRKKSEPSGEKRKKSTKSTRGYKTRPAEQHAAASQVLDAGKTREQTAIETGLTEHQVQLATERELGRREMLGELLSAADTKHFSESGALRIDAAIRVQKKALERDYEQRRTKEVQQLFERAFPKLQEKENAASKREQTYHEFMKKQTKIMTVAEYTLVCSLLHPDSRASASDERLRRAFQMFEPKKFPLTGEK